MTPIKEPAAAGSRYRPARELAARATSKHGNPADFAIAYAVDVIGAAPAVAASLYVQASRLAEISGNGTVSIQSSSSGARVAVLVRVARDSPARSDHGGFSLTFAPREGSRTCPRFEGQFRVEQIDAASCRVVAQGRYGALPDQVLMYDECNRENSEFALAEIVRRITENLLEARVAQPSTDGLP